MRRYSWEHGFVSPSRHWCHMSGRMQCASTVFSIRFRSRRLRVVFRYCSSWSLSRWRSPPKSSNRPLIPFARWYGCSSWQVFCWVWRSPFFRLSWLFADEWWSRWKHQQYHNDTMGVSAILQRRQPKILRHPWWEEMFVRIGRIPETAICNWSSTKLYFCLPWRCVAIMRRDWLRQYWRNGSTSPWPDTRWVQERMFLLRILWGCTLWFFRVEDTLPAAIRRGFRGFRIREYRKLWSKQDIIHWKFRALLREAKRLLHWFAIHLQCHDRPQAGLSETLRRLPFLRGD